MAFNTLLVEDKDGIRRITLNRPDKLNALNRETLTELHAAFSDAATEPSVRVVVLTGAGPKAFVAGADIAEMNGLSPAQARDFSAHGQALMTRIERLGKPVIARINGFAIGGGHVFATLCDLSIMADTAKLGQVGHKVGSVDAGWGTAFLARHVGDKKAREIWFLTRQYDAQEALSMGLVNTVVPLKELEAETVSWCREMLQNSPMALRLLKASMNAADDGLAGIQQLAGDATLLFYLSEEGQEGRDAYKEKRKPDFGKFPRRP